uniref:Uncharacterized protein n=1 Tax=Cucumis sativus TaxID=3659 RepID=A0A0A0L0Y5_CUCSA
MAQNEIHPSNDNPCKFVEKFLTCTNKYGILVMYHKLHSLTSPFFRTTFPGFQPLQCAHVMAMAVQKLFPDAKVTIGPWIENGFCYDFDIEPLGDKDLMKIKKEMERIISTNLPLVREEVSRDKA